MKIITQYHEIEHITPNILYQTEVAARNCWKSEGKIGCTKGLDELCQDLIWDCCVTHCINSTCYAHSAQKLITMLIKKEHDAVLEFGSVTIRLVTSRSVLAELTRHRIGVSYAVESQRYVSYKNNIEFIKPIWWRKENELIPNSNEWLFIRFCIDSELCYKKMIQNGWRSEESREILPNCTKTEIVFKANIRSLRNMFRLRTSKKAHPMIRSLFTNLLIDLKERIPVVFDDIGCENG